MYKHFIWKHSKVQLYDYICKICDEIRFLVDYAVLCKQSLRNSVATDSVADAPVTRTPYGTSEKRALDSLSKPPLFPFKHKHIQGNTLVTL